MRKRSQVRAGLICLVLAATGRAGLTQEPAPLTLREAVAVSIAKNPDTELAQLEVEAAQSGQRLARIALLPRLSFSEQATRGNDPVYVFGTLLRQQRFNQSDFALNSLNRPLPANNFLTQFSGDWMAFDSWRTEFEIKRADLIARSASVAASRSEQEVVDRTVEAYESILFAARQEEVARTDLDTARALLDSSHSRVQAGLAVDADRLAAAANVAQREQSLIAAEGNVQVAWAALEAAIGTRIPVAQRRVRGLEERQFELAPLDDLVALALKSRPDRQSLSLQLEAQHAALQSARSAFGPQISTFGNWQTDRQSIAGAGGNNWTAGAELRVDLLPAAKRENLTAAKIALRRTQAQSASADQRIRLQVTQAYYEHQAAQQMLAVARASTAQTQESLRILRDRYEAGLATMTDLLRAEDAERQSRANYWQAVFQNSLTYANLKFATGTLNPVSAEDLQ